MTRVPMLRTADLAAEYRSLLEEMERARGFVPNLYRVMAHAPGLMASFITFTTSLRSDAALSQRDKELVILLVGHLTGAGTIVAAHRGFARASGLDDRQIDAVAGWTDSAAFDSRERAMLGYAQAVTRDIRVDDATWNALRAHLTDAQLAELTMVAACYNMVARFLEPLEIEVDPRYAS